MIVCVRGGLALQTMRKKAKLENLCQHRLQQIFVNVSRERQRLDIEPLCAVGRRLRCVRFRPPNQEFDVPHEYERRSYYNRRRHESSYI
jgi:hypothetical protein